MAVILQTPSVVSVTPFDPSQSHIIEFIYSGNQPVKNRVIISNNDTGVIVYDNIQETMKLQHEIPANSLTPGVQYLLQLQVYDINENSSNLSDPILFYCFTTPQFTFENISDDDFYRNASITLSISYEQAEGELLKSIQFLEYSYDKILLSQSSTIYTLETHTFYGLENNTIYYFRAIGETVHGISLDTGYIKLNVEYKTLPANVVFVAENNYCEGYVKLTSNIKDVEYEFESDDYVLSDGVLVLNNNSLTYKNSFEVDSDFVLFVEAKKLPLQTFLTTNDNIFSLSIVNICDSYYCKLTVKDSDLSMFTELPKARISTDAGDLIITDDGKTIEIVNTSYDDDDLVIFEVKRIGNCYSLNSYYRADI